MEDIFNYKILSVIGEGGMGMVYLGEHTKLGRKVAIKELHEALTVNPQFRERFINEAKILAKLSHHNIVTIYDFIDIKNKYYIIMEYIDGLTLDQLLEKGPQEFSQDRVVRLFRQVLSAFGYAHRQGIIHRDIKPSNVIVGRNDTAKILDFGIAKIISAKAKLTRPGMKIGSVYYMSPEQVMGRDIDSRSDIYSLGVLLYEMLSGRMPYTVTTETEYEIMEKIVKEPILPIRNLNPDIHFGLEQIIFRSCEKNPDFRFSNCDDFLTALDNLNYTYTRQIPEREINQSINSAGQTREYAVPQYQYAENAPPGKKKINTVLLIVIMIVAILAIAELVYLISTSGSSDTTIESDKKSGTEEKAPQTTPPVNPPETQQPVKQYKDDESLVKSFLEDLGTGDFSSAYSKTKNPNWGNYDHFSSVNGFGGIISTKVFDLYSVSNNGSTAIVYIDYEAVDPVNDSKHPERGSNPRYTQYFHLQKYYGDWKITKTKNTL